MHDTLLLNEIRPGRLVEQPWPRGGRERGGKGVHTTAAAAGVIAAAVGGGIMIERTRL